MSWEKIKNSKPNKCQIEKIRYMSKLVGRKVVEVKTMDEAAKLIMRYEKLFSY